MGRIVTQNRRRDFKHSAELLIFSKGFKSSAEYLESSFERLKGSAVCFKTNTRSSVSLTLFRMGFFGAAHLWSGGEKACPPPTYLTIVIPYLKKIQKNYESRDTPLEFC